MRNRRNGSGFNKDQKRNFENNFLFKDLDEIESTDNNPKICFTSSAINYLDIWLIELK